jgi:quinol monooxygenase YgiN
VAMFGTVFAMRPKPGQEKDVEQMLERWNRERRPKVSGVVASYLFTSRANAGQLLGVAVFASEDDYRRNANDPDQDRWYQELRSHLEADPEWNDGDVLAF